MKQSRPTIETFSDRANRSVMNTVLFTTIVLVVAAITAAVGTGIWNNWQSGRYDTVQDNRLSETNLRVDTTETNINTLNTNLEYVNTTLCDKIMIVNNTIQTQIDDINDELNITGVTGTSFRENVTNEFIIVHMNLSDISTDLQNLTGRVDGLDASVIKTVNMVVAPDVNNNVNILPADVGLEVFPDGNTLRLNNTGVRSIIAGQGIDISQPTLDVTISSTGILNVNGVGPTSGGELFLSGTSGITISENPTMNQIYVNGTDLTTAITNNQITISVIEMQISNLTTVTNQQQTEINVLTQTLVTLGQMLNGTEIDINMTLTELIMDVLMLKDQVAALEDQLANSSSTIAPTGTIVPWGGTAGNVPSGYLLCDGSSVAIATYDDLHMVIGCQYCPGGVCTLTDFCLPDLRGKLPVGQASSGAFSGPINTNVGEEEVTLTLTTLPSHTHAVTGVAQSVGSEHQHTILTDSTSDDSVGDPAPAMGGSYSARYESFRTSEPVETMPYGSNCVEGAHFDGCSWNTGDSGPASARQWTGHDGGRHSHALDAGATATGSGMPHQNIQPSIITAGYIIKT